MLLCPLTFMNQSGKSVRACADYYHIERHNIAVIHDDLDLTVGRIKIVRGGGAGGHKGALSVMEHLDGTEFPRIKIGIGRPRYGEPIERFVLGPFYADEKAIMEQVVLMAVKGCKWMVSEGVESAMNHMNCQKLVGEEVEN